MLKVYRIVQDERRTKDLSGTGAYRFGGRWNSKGTYMLYTSENSSLALLESLVHYDKVLSPPDQFLIILEISDVSLVWTVPDEDYNKDWSKLSLIANQRQGDRWMNDEQFLGIKIRSAINSMEYNYLLNPLFPRFNDLVSIKSVLPISLDSRLL